VKVLGARLLTQVSEALRAACTCILQVLKLVSLPVWHSLSPGRLQLELAAQPALAKRWKTLLKKEAKAAKAAAAAKDAGAAAAAAAELPKAEASFLPGMLQEFLKCLRTADALLTGQYQQQQQQQEAASAAAAAAAAAAEESSSDEEGDEQQQEEQDGAEAAAKAAQDGADGMAAAEAEAPAANGHSNGPVADAGDQQQGRGRGRGRRRGRGRGRGRSGGRRGGGGRGGSGQRRLGKRLLLHLERFVEFLLDLLSQLPTRRFVHALVEDQQLLVKVGWLAVC
jgi:hypothetical protein